MSAAEHTSETSKMEQANEWACKSEWINKWPSTHIPILGWSEPQCDGPTDRQTNYGSCLTWNVSEPPMFLSKNWVNVATNLSRSVWFHWRQVIYCCLYFSYHSSLSQVILLRKLTTYQRKWDRRWCIHRRWRTFLRCHAASIAWSPSLSTDKPWKKKNKYRVVQEIALLLYFISSLFYYFTLNRWTNTTSYRDAKSHVPIGNTKCNDFYYHNSQPWSSSKGHLVLPMPLVLTISFYSYFVRHNCNFALIREKKN